jgi:hypothetical protein
VEVGAGASGVAWVEVSSFTSTDEGSTLDVVKTGAGAADDGVTGGAGAVDEAGT